MEPAPCIREHWKSTVPSSDRVRIPSKERIDTEHEQRVVCDARDTRANELPPRADDRVVATREAEDRIGWAESVSIEQSEHARSELSTPRSSFVRTVGRAWIEGVPITLDAGSRLRLTPTAGRQLACRFLGETRGRTDDRELHVTSADPSEVYS